MRDSVEYDTELAVSMKSGLEGRNNNSLEAEVDRESLLSQ